MMSERFLRQEFLNNIKPNSQNILKEKNVLILGAGGLGSPVLFYLAAAGIGKMTIVDKDTVNVSNLNRQILYTTDMIGKNKSEMAALTIKSFNPDITVKALTGDITCKLLDDIIPCHDLVFDCCDNHETRMTIAQICHKHNAVCVVSGINELEGFTFLSIPGKTACYGCLYDNKPPKKNEKPQVLGANAGVIGSLAVSIGISYLLDYCKINKIIVSDLYNLNFETVDFYKSKNCSICSE